MELSGDINPAFNNAGLSCVSQHIFICSLDFLSPSLTLCTSFRTIMKVWAQIFLWTEHLYRNAETPKLDAFMIFHSLQLKLQSTERRGCVSFELFLTKHCLVLLQSDFVCRYRLLVYFPTCIWFGAHNLLFMSVLLKGHRHEHSIRILAQEQGTQTFCR